MFEKGYGERSFYEKSPPKHSYMSFNVFMASFRLHKLGATSLVNGKVYTKTRNFSSIAYNFLNKFLRLAKSTRKGDGIGSLIIFISSEILLISEKYE